MQSILMSLSDSSNWNVQCEENLIRLLTHDYHFLRLSWFLLNNRILLKVYSFFVHTFRRVITIELIVVLPRLNRLFSID